MRGETSLRGQRKPSGLIARLAIAIFAAFALTATPAFGAVSAPVYKITSNLPAFPTVPSDGPSSLVAGANPDAGSYTTFAYGGSTTEDLKTALTNFAPGLLGNPESVPKCPEASLQTNTCPPSSLIGTSRLDVKLAGGASPFTGFPGFVYNAEPLGNEPGRLGVVTPSAGLVSSIPFHITPRGGGDYGLTGTLTDISRLDAVNLGPPFGVQNLQVHALAFVLNGSTNKYVRNPTSCGQHISTGQAIGYDDPTVAESPPYAFGTTGCEQLPFGPTVALTVGDKGTTKFNGYPPLAVKITQPAGQADQLGNKLTLPIELNTNNTAYKLCSQAQADSDSCPANSKFGGVVAKSPFLAQSLSGPVYLIQQTATSLPGLLLDLNGRVHVKIQTKTSLVGGKQIQSLVNNAPQLPVSELTVALNGGKSTGVFQNRQDLCFNRNSTSKFNSVIGVVKQFGWNGTNTADTKITSKVNGCGPAVKSRLSGATHSEPSLSITVTKHPDSANLKELTVSLSTGLSLVKSRLGGGAGGTAAKVTLGKSSFKYVNSHTFKVTGLPAAGTSKVAIRLRKGALRLRDSTRSQLARGRTKTFAVKVKPTFVSGSGASTRAKFKVKSKKR